MKNDLNLSQLLDRKLTKSSEESARQLSAVNDKLVDIADVYLKSYGSFLHFFTNGIVKRFSRKMKIIVSVTGLLTTNEV